LTLEEQRRRGIPTEPVLIISPVPRKDSPPRTRTRGPTGACAALRLH
jgi:hypothetical protein